MMRRAQTGLTLVEMMAAITVFTIITLGIVPLLASSIRASDISRAGTVGKNIAVEAMERVRGLPFHISDERDPNDVDVLDLYYPGVQGGGASYVTTCTSGDQSARCPGGLPDDYRVVYMSEFLSTDASSVVPAPAGYDSHPDTATEDDEPVTNLLRMTVRSEWDFRGATRNFTLVSLIGNRTFGRDTLDGNALLDYVVQVTTSYPTNPDATNLTVTAGAGDATINQRTTSAAAAATIAAASITAQSGDDDPSEISGLSTTVAAPPNATASAATVGPQAGPLINGSLAAGFDTTSLANAPTAAGGANVGANPQYGRIGFSFGSTTGNGNVWVAKPQALLPGPLQLSTNRVLSVQGGLTGYTNASATSPTLSGLTSRASGSLANLRLFPTAFAPSGVVQVNGFSATIQCGQSSQGAPDATEASYGAEIVVSIDTDVRRNSARETLTIPVSSSTSGDALAPYASIPTTGPGDSPATVNSTNPLIYQDPVPAAGTEVQNSAPNDLYLFPQTHFHTRTGNTIRHDHGGYLSGWRSRQDVERSPGSLTSPATASIGEVIGIDTVAIPRSVGDPSAALGISLGSMSCSALDRR